MRSKVKKSFVGRFRSLEVTYGRDKRKDSCGTFHPHLHVLLVVDNEQYFKDSECYFSTEELSKLWGECLGVDYDPIVHIEKVTDDVFDLPHSVAECAKYAVKSDVLFGGDVCLMGDNPDEKNIDAFREMDSIVFALDEALRGRRLVSFGGLLKKIHDELNLDDSVDGDLIHVEGDEAGSEDEREQIIVRYFWNRGAGDYCLIPFALEWSSYG